MKCIPPAGQWAIASLLIAALLGSVLYTLWRFDPETSVAAENFQLAFKRLELPPVPPHVPDSFLADVQGLGGFAAVLDSREPDLLARLADAFARHPSVERVGRVVRVSPRQIKVELEFRRPVVVVLVGPRRYPVDVRGVLLPDAPESVTRHLLTVEGCGRPPDVVPGKHWGLPSVETAASLAGSIGRERDAFDLAAIEIRQAAAEHEISLRTRKGSRIVWSGASSREREPSAAVKLQRLREYRQQYGSLDLPAGPYLLDVRFATGGILRKPLPRD